MVVPVAILVALSLTAIGGTGLGGLGALSQVVSGPAVAGSDLTVDTGGAEIGDAVTQLAAIGTGTAGEPGATAPGTGPGSGGGDGQVPGGTAPPTGGDQDPGDLDDTTPPDGGGGEGGGPGPPKPPPPEPRGVVEEIGEGVKDVTDGTPVAPTVEDAVDGLVEVCRGLGCP